MLLGPLFRVEMVSVARRRRYFVLRVVYGLLALFILWSTYTSMRAFSMGTGQTVSIQQGAMLAGHFFVSFSWLQILAVLAVGPAMAVGTIASERERRTIEYLFTTDLSNSEIILGKLAARLCLFGQLLLVGLPILFLFRLLGGIPAQLLVVTFLFAASTSLLIASLSICVSVWSERARDATVRVYLLLGVLTFLPIILHSATGWGPFQGALWDATGRPVVDFCISINPLWSMGTAIGNTNAIGANLDMALIWQTIGKQVLVSVAAVGLAIFAVRRVHLKETTKAANRERRSKQWRLPKWRRSLRNDPMIWKEIFAGTATTKRGIIGWVAIALILLTVCGIMLTLLIHAIQSSFAGRSNHEFHFGIMGLTGYLGTGILLLLAARAAGLMTSEKERDCWLSLISTPLTGREIVRGKMWGNLYSLRWPLFVLAVNWAIGVLLAPAFLLPAIALLATFTLMAWYVTNLGLFFSLRSQTTLRAMGATLGTLIFTGGGYMFCCCMVAASGGGPREPFMIFLAGCIPFLLLFPSLAYFDFVQDMGMRLEEGMSFAYGAGVLSYLAVSWCLYAYMAHNFDQLAGRTVEVWERKGRIQNAN